MYAIHASEAEAESAQRAIARHAARTWVTTTQTAFQAEALPTR
jgi:hypothetical protein